MNINIGENIRNLRRQKDITQEELSEHLGISFQSISKWERGDGLPDITMLPDLADFFDVTIDDLIGADRMSGGYFSDVYKQAHGLEIKGDYDKAIELLRDTLKKYPNHYDMTAKLSSMLLFLDENSEEGKFLAKKAITLCERDLSDSNKSEKHRVSARAMLCFLYENIGDHQKAIDLASKLPHVWETREVLWGELMEEQEYTDYLKKLILAVLSVIIQKIDSVYDSSKKINIIDMIFMSPGDDVANRENNREIIEKIVGFLG